MKAVNLKTHYLVRPIGIDIVKPRLTWTAVEGKRQTAYEICTSKNGEADWKSGKVETASMHAVYGGVVESRDIVTWKVRLYDENGEAGEWSEEALFEIGLLEESDWSAKWICGHDTDKEERLPADYYRKIFCIGKKENDIVTDEKVNGIGEKEVNANAVKIRKARLYATACGIYEAYLNGVRVGNRVLAPGSTEYGKRIYYQTYDVTGLIQAENELSFVVGDGWLKGKLGCDAEEYFYGTQTKLLAQLELEFEDGTMQTVSTDDSFAWTNDGPVRYSDLKDGIVMDMNKELHFERKAVVTCHDVWPTASNAPSVKEMERFKPEVLTTPSGKCVLDFGQNMAGYVVFHVTGNKGQKIVVRMGETLDNGEFTQENFATLKSGDDAPKRGKSIDQKVEIICDGKNVPDYPKLFYSGFRYALVEGMDEVRPSDFTAVAIYSDIEYGGEFECSNEMVNQFVKNTIWSEKGNFVDVPTDCPQREKAGWTGDAQVFQKTAMYFSETAAFYRKWLRDVRDSQREDGQVNNVCPRIRSGGQTDALNGSTGWADAAVIIPYQLWKYYGDESFITDNYDLMMGWKAYVVHAAADKSIYQLPEEHPMKKMLGSFLLGDVPYKEYIIESGTHWGEWAEPEGVLEWDGITELVRPKQEENTAYLHYSMRLLAEMLEAIGESDEAAKCRKYSEGAKKAYQCNFVKNQDIESKRQAKLVRPLALGVLDEASAKNVAARLDETAKSRDYKIGTGFLSTPFILPVLADYGYVDTAYKMLENEEEPGWLAMVKQGATTVWEHYNGYDKDGHPLDTSFNHYSPGAVCSFLFEYTCGIRPAGERKFLLKPVSGGSFTFARAKWESPYGTVTAKWKREGENFTYEVEVPANCEADIELPDGQMMHVGAGKHKSGWTM